MVVVIIYTFLQVVIGILEQAHYTLEAFINTAGTGIDQEIFDLGLDGTHTSGSDIGFRFRIGTNDILRLPIIVEVVLLVSVMILTSTPISRGRWYHVAYVRDGNNFLLLLMDKELLESNKFFIGELEFTWGVKLGYAHAWGVINTLRDKFPMLHCKRNCFL